MKMGELIKDGLRIDGRKPDELRPIKIEAGVLYRADGSAYVEWGGNKVLAAVYGPRELLPKHMQDPTKAVVNARYNMASFSVEDRKRPGPDRRSIEISKVTSEALESVIFTELFPRAVIDINIEILDAEAGTRCAGITAAAVALADAGIPMRDIPAACAAGKVDGQVVLDLRKEEDQEGEADLPIAIAPRTEEILLLQMDGHLTYKEFEEALELAIKGSKYVSKLQKEALRRKYKKVEEE
ncbi:MAG: exosome complex exonuclease Rrp41 [Thermoplasmata archaeon]|nr:exosome complex exonuclease Rrp41 [Thermoplasmata archaeon]